MSEHHALMRPHVTPPARRTVPPPLTTAPRPAPSPPLCGSPRTGALRRRARRAHQSNTTRTALICLVMRKSWVDSTLAPLCCLGLLETAEPASGFGVRDRGVTVGSDGAKLARCGGS